jgi:hypothetical protein
MHHFSKFVTPATSSWIKNKDLHWVSRSIANLQPANPWRFRPPGCRSCNSFLNRPGTAGKHDVNATLLNASNGDPVSRRPAGVKSQDSGTKLVPLFAAVKRPKKGVAFHWVYS